MEKDAFAKLLDSSWLSFRHQLLEEKLSFVSCELNIRGIDLLYEMYEV